jgi:uncharacterized membrane protein HdeD (DUF308 family)
MPFMFKSTSTSLILLGILAVIVGVIAIAWPGVTILALVILFAIYAFMAAGLQGARAFSSRNAGPVFGHLLLALLGLAAGVIALVWPSPTALVLTLVVGVWAVIGGLIGIFAGFGPGETAGTRTMFILTGLIWVAFGVVLFVTFGVELFVTVIVVPVELTVVATCCWTIGQSQVRMSTRWSWPLPNFTRGPPAVPSVVAHITSSAETPWATVMAGFSMARSPGASVSSWRTLPWMRPKNVTVLVDWGPLP